MFYASDGLLMMAAWLVDLVIHVCTLFEVESFV